MTMMTSTTPAVAPVTVTGGVDSHADVHVAAVIDQVGRELGDRAFPTTPDGYRALLAWLRSFGPLAMVGVEGTGSYAAGLTRMLMAAAVPVVEVNRPDRRARRMDGKSDPIDAYAAARAALSGRASATPKDRTGTVEMIRNLRVAKRGAVKARTAAWNQLHAVITTAPDGLRDQLRGLKGAALLDTCTGLRPNRGPAPTRRGNATRRLNGTLTDPTAATKATVRSIARRIRSLEAEVAALEDDLTPLVKATAPTLLELQGVGIDVAGQLLVTVGDNPDRMRSEAAFAHLCGVAPIPASSGRVQRHRLNRGGDRHANHALWIMATTRLRCDPQTRAYHDRRAQAQHSNKDIVRSLKRVLARHVHRALMADLVPAQNAT